MDQKTEIRPRIISSISNSGLLIILALILLVSLMSIIIARQFASPDRLIMTTGFERGAYTILGERYQQIIAREKVQLKLLPSSGSIENLKRLKDKISRVDAGFVQDGTSSLSEAENLVSLGAICYAPLWVFYRSQ